MLFSHSSDVRIITYAACLAHQGLLDIKDNILKLENVDLSLIPVEQLTSLASCVTRIKIKNVRGCDLSFIFKGLQRSSKICYFSKQNLSSEETQDLVQAMESHVMVVKHGEEGELGDVILDIKALTEYSGQGMCRQIICNKGIVTSHREELETWAKSHNWIFFECGCFVIFMR